MESSRILVEPGLRTLARPGWRAGLAIALSAVASKPDLWLHGMIGFCLRGGVLLLTLPIIVLPTQVEARLLIGSYLGSTGFSPAFFGLIAAAAVVATGLTVCLLLVLARSELASFERLIEDQDAADMADLRPFDRSASGRARLLVPLFGVQVLAFVVLLAAAAPVAWAAAQTSFDEITRPSSSAPIYERVLGQIGGPLFIFLTALVVIEMVSALASRELLVRAFGWRGVPSKGRLWLLPAFVAAVIRPFRSPIRTVGTAAISWAVTVAVLVPAVWAITIAWAAVRGAYLTSVSLSDISADIGMIVAALGLSAAFVLAIALAGFASALRGALWSVDRLR